MSQEKAQKNYSLSKLLDNIPNRFVLSLAIANRARQLKEGASPLVEVKQNMSSPIQIAIKELEEKKVMAVLSEITKNDENIIDEIKNYLDTETIEILSESDKKDEFKPAQ